MNAQTAPAKKSVFKSPGTEPPQNRLAPAKVLIWSKDQDLHCPVSGSTVFAKVPRIQLRSGFVFPTGNIYLRYGKHYGPNSGFGFEHIWKEHFPHIVDHDTAMERVVSTISQILRSDTHIYHDASRIERKNGRPRANVHRLHVGIAIIELWQAEGATPHYSVITGGFNPGQTKGSLVGALA